MNVDLKADYPLTDDACRQATGATMKEWFDRLSKKPELSGKRRDAINWMYEQMNKNAWWPTTIWVEWQKNQGIVLKDGKSDGYNICVTKTVGAPVSDVFKAFSDNRLAGWLGDGAKSTADNHITDSKSNKGTAVRVRDPKDLRYKWQTAGAKDETEVDIMFAENAGKTGITLNHNRIQTREEADGLRRAWGEALERLKSMMEGKS
jgi:uncharacterized protein YndB with AHSA1/START domain